jgi:hypothetical protein
VISPYPGDMSAPPMSHARSEIFGRLSSNTENVKATARLPICRRRAAKSSAG